MATEKNRILSYGAKLPIPAQKPTTLNCDAFLSLSPTLPLFSTTPIALSASACVYLPILPPLLWMVSPLPKNLYAKKILSIYHHLYEKDAMFRHPCATHYSMLLFFSQSAQHWRCMYMRPKAKFRPKDGSLHRCVSRVGFDVDGSIPFGCLSSAAPQTKIFRLKETNRWQIIGKKIGRLKCNIYIL